MIAAVAVILSGCSKPVGEVLGFEKNAPDEFAVVKRAPLTLPPDFGLRPPRPGAPRPQEVSSRDSAQEALIGTSSESDRPVRSDSRAARAQRTKGLSPAEVALLTKSGALDVDPSIRDVINKEAAGAADTADESFVDKLLFWRDKKSGDKASGDTVVDASKERRRLQENEALGKPVTAGKTPTIRRKEGSIFF